MASVLWAGSTPKRLRRLGNVEVIGVAGRTAEAARKFADNLGIERATGNYQDLLADPELDAVHICTPNELHFPMAQAAMQAGKHVLCEKPLASTIDEAKAMIALAAEKKLANCTFYNVRAYPQVQNMRRMREAGDLGEILVVQGTYSQDWLLYDTDWNWRIESGPSRTFADIGTHWCDLAEHITGAAHHFPVRRSHHLPHHPQEAQRIRRDLHRQDTAAE